MADKDEELPELKAVYDALWSDARTMIKDMKRSIYIYLFTGFITLVFSVIMIGTAISDWNKILSGNIGTFTYLYAIAGTLGSVIYVAFGILLLYWYNKLKNRYARVIQLEKTIRD
jgi:uncharacterized BrkB/YihY/UPF0761 family membrane protein